MKKIVILGSNGMLGQMVKKYFIGFGCEIFVFDYRINEETIFDIIARINDIEDAIVVNCIGKIKQKSNDTCELLWSNSILPLELSRSLKPTHFLIQPSTDCVFDGNSLGHYKVTDVNNAKDVYGWSKSLGEAALQQRPNTLIIRVSIIGPDEKSDKGLFSWFCSLSENSKINGFINHFWNGITTLEWCKYLDSYFLTFQTYEKNTVQLGTNKIYSKYEILNLLNAIFNKKIDIVPSDQEVAINRCLIPDFECKSLVDQLIELRDFMYEVDGDN